MKRLFIFLLVLISLLVSFFLNTKHQTFSFSQIFSQASITIYTNYSVDDTSINAGNLYITQFQNNNSVNVLGESFTTIEFDVSKICTLLKAKIVKTEQVENMNITYAYSPFISKHLFIDGKKTNLQIVERSNDIILGWPLILGSI